MDTDGHMHLGGYDFISKSKQLANDVVDLARGLGLAAYAKQCRKGCQNGFVGTYHRVGISGDCSVIPCHLPRKKAPKRRQIKNVLRTGFKLRRLGVENFYGFTLSGDGRYLLGDYTVTHNSGKTRSLVHRVVKLVLANRVDGERILAVTFGKEPAREMNTRLSKLGVTSAHVSTWHSLALQILKEDATEWSDWRIDEKDRAKFLIKEALGHRHLDWKKADLGKVRGFIGLCKANLLSFRDKGAKDLAKKIFDWQGSLALDAYALSQRMIEAEELLTFDDFLVFVHQHLSKSEDNRLRWASKWDYVLQDEYQDTNEAQVAIAEMLARDHRNYMVVGDCAQSIFSFRGSMPSALESFEKIWGARRIAMVRNYRSGRKIVEAANAVIRSAKVRMPEEMVAMRDLDGVARVNISDNLDDEASAAATWLKEHVADGGALSDCVIGFRTNAQSRAVEEALLRNKIPYILLGGHSFYERKEIRDLLGYLRVSVAQDPDGESLRRCINTPFRFLGRAFVDRVLDLVDHVRRGEATWSDVVGRVAEQSGVQSRQRTSAADWSRLVEQIGEMIAEDKVPSIVLNYIVTKTDFIRALEREEGEESIESSHGANVRELIRVSSGFATCIELLEYIDETIKATKKQRRSGHATIDRVVLSSLHKQKGLEWKKCWVVGCNELVLPHKWGDLEEERRLMYVAITRARDEIVLSCVREFAMRGGVVKVAPSRFIRDAGLSIPSDDPDDDECYEDEDEGNFT